MFIKMRHNMRDNYIRMSTIESLYVCDGWLKITTISGREYQRPILADEDPEKLVKAIIETTLGLNK